MDQAEQPTALTAEEVLRRVWRALGPSVPVCIKCRGCRHEWETALKYMTDYYGTDEYRTDREANESPITPT